MPGIGNSVIRGRSVGGSGVVLIHDLEAHVTAVGVPAHVVGSYSLRV